MKKYVIGVDFGTLSARAVVLDVYEKKIVSEFTSSYKHGVMDSQLPDGTQLPEGFALQHPQDYIESLSASVKGAVTTANISPDEVGGIGVDFTSSTVLPIDKEGTPLAIYDEFKNEPHAYVKLWKHHSAQGEADEFTAVAKSRGESWLSIYGGVVSSEYMFPKILETARQAPKVYEKAYRFIEAGDWLNMILTGKETHAAAFVGYKSFWNAENGYPSNDYFVAVDPLLDKVVGTKVSTDISTVDKNAGQLSQKGAKLVGLDVGTPVSLAMLDAHAAMPALNITDNGRLMLILGTSGCHLINSDKEITVDGICGRVKNGVFPNTTTYEAGQQCFGDAFDWFVSNCVPKAYFDEAEKDGKSIFQYLTEKAAELQIGESGIVALDWFNGNRSVLVNSRLKGALIGLTIHTKPYEIYRALLEAASFGTRRIVEQFESFGIRISAVSVAGGIANKNPLLMQIMADVLGRELEVTSTTQAAALGSAIYASVAGGFYSDIVLASRELSAPISKKYVPVPDNSKSYDKLYEEYLTLHDYFGKTNMIMERL